MAAILTTAAFWMFAASTVIQTVQANKIRDAQQRARNEAEEKADAQRGFQIVTTETPVALPVVYGRAKIGGSRVYHATFSNYNFPSNLDTLLEGRATILSGNAPFVPPVLEAGKVRAYFVGPPGFVPAAIANTAGIAAIPNIVAASSAAQDRGDGPGRSVGFNDTGGLGQLGRNDAVGGFGGDIHSTYA